MDMKYVVYGMLALCILGLASCCIYAVQELNRSAEGRMELQTRLDSNVKALDAERSINLEQIRESEEVRGRIDQLGNDNQRLKGDLAILEGNADSMENIINLLTVMVNSTQTSSSIVVINNERATGTPVYHIPDNQQEIQNLSEPDDQWQEFCFQERRTNTTLCYRKAE